MKRIQKKKAFTLVEMIVVLALLGIIGSGLIGIIVPSTNIFTRIGAEVQAKMKSNQVMRVVLDQTEFAKDLELITNSALIGEDAEKRYLYTNNGKLYMQSSGSTIDLFGDDFYDGYEVSLSARKMEKNLVELTLNTMLSGSPNVNHTLTTTLRSLNTSEVAGDNGGIIAYVWENP
ncbi:MAG: prepilin-type N-terminal cleavage/methylation domain-containing protein [Christensenellales bacterium]|jgi:prepilin-type N-terminal cleavage/methylation domain-containing protein